MEQISRIKYILKWFRLADEHNQAENDQVEAKIDGVLSRSQKKKRSSITRLLTQNICQLEKHALAITFVVRAGVDNNVVAIRWNPPVQVNFERRFWQRLRRRNNSWHEKDDQYFQQSFYGGAGGGKLNLEDQGGRNLYA